MIGKKSIVIIQARMGSHRLPGKALLPIENIPIIILVAKRAANTGRPVVVATSNKASDDILVKSLIKNNISFYRGSSENVLSRFVNIVKKFNNEQIIFRLTADNVFPDGRLLDEMEKFFLKNKNNYLTCGDARSGLPYGVSVELMRVKHIREAGLKSESLHEKEHVTLYIAKKMKVSFFSNYKKINMQSYRCTIDTLEDYKKIKKIFNGLGKKSFKISFNDLIKRLHKLENVSFKKNKHKIILGTAQLGAKYGIMNKSHKPSSLEVNNILRKAIANGVEHIDTARTYKNSEKIIGDFLNNKIFLKKKICVLTKLPGIAECGYKPNYSQIKKIIYKNISHSLSDLNQKKINTLMLHQASYLTKWHGKVIKCLLGLKKKKIIDKIGVSIQTPSELKKVLSCKHVEHIQLPFNILDWRWENFEKKILQRKKKGEFTVHARSPLLQGLILSTDSLKWKKANLKNSKKVINWIDSSVTVFRKKSIIDLSLAFVNSIDWIDGIVIGVVNTKQLMENISVISRSKLSKENLKQIKETRPILTNLTLNPALWKNK